MRLLSYLLGGEPRYGAAVDGGVVDLTRRIGRDYSDMKALIAANALADARQAVAGLITADLLVHSWDLARSIGADATLPDGEDQLQQHLEVLAQGVPGPHHDVHVERLAGGAENGEGLALLVRRTVLDHLPQHVPETVPLLRVTALQEVVETVPRLVEIEAASCVL